MRRDGCVDFRDSVKVPDTNNQPEEMKQLDERAL
jgi:hypothetical protein